MRYAQKRGIRLVKLNNGMVKSRNEYYRQKRAQMRKDWNNLDSGEWYSKTHAKAHFKGFKPEKAILVRYKKNKVKKDRNNGFPKSLFS